MQGVGSYDRVAIQWGYSQGPANATPEQERARLNAIVNDMIAKGTVWGNYADPRWNAYDDGPDPVTWLKQTMPVRDALLAHYGPQMLHAGEPNPMLTARFPLVYLFHRYALASAVNVVGGGDDSTVPGRRWTETDYSVDCRCAETGDRVDDAGDEPVGTRSACRAVADPEVRMKIAITIPRALELGRVFVQSPGWSAEVAAVVVKGLLDAKRMQRLAVLSPVGSQPSPAFVISALLKEGFATPAKNAQQEDLLAVVQEQIADRLMMLATNGDATPEVRAEALAGVHDAQSAIKKSGPGRAMLQQIDHEIMLFLQNPEQNTPKVKDSGAPAGPPV